MSEWEERRTSETRMLNGALWTPALSPVSTDPELLGISTGTTGSVTDLLTWGPHKHPSLRRHPNLQLLPPASAQMPHCSARGIWTQCRALQGLRGHGHTRVTSTGGWNLPPLREVC